MNRRGSQSFLLQFSRDAVVDEIIGFEFGKLCIALGEKLERALDPFFRRYNAPIVE
jgi:hypothetical protein